MIRPLKELIAQATESLSQVTLPIRAPAKVNLRLKVLGRRSDGYHRLSMLNATIDLCDELGIRFRNEAGVRLIVSPQDQLVGPPEENLVSRAFCFFWEEFGLPTPPIGFDCFIAKKIPIGAGLGGGSSDAGGMLRALCASYGAIVSRSLNLHQREFMARVQRVALRCGADVPYAVSGGFCWVGGVGEDVVPLESSTITGLSGLIVIMVPPEPISTATFYQAFRVEYPFVSDGHDAVREGWGRDFSLGESSLEDVIVNDFEPVVTKLAPSVGLGLRIARKYFPVTTGVTGSGSAFFSYVSTAAEELVSEAERELLAAGIRTVRCRFLL